MDEFPVSAKSAKGRRSKHVEESKSNMEDIFAGDSFTLNPSESSPKKSSGTSRPVTASSKPPESKKGWGIESEPKPGATITSRIEATAIEADIAAIPEIGDEVSSDRLESVARAPITTKTVASYVELASDLHKHAAFSMLPTADGQLDITLISKVLRSEAEVNEGDDAWEPEHLYAELASDLRGEGGAIGEHTIELEPDSASAGSEKEKRKQVGASKKRGSFSNIFGSN